ncbi:MAG: heparinase II/III family protein [Candidatus Latescibacteria bacterium]|nr:heparinase II/III family protein [Candidatus Latescibacterota bacterium]
MSTPMSDLRSLPLNQFQRLRDSGTSLVPELEAARLNRQALCVAPQTQVVLAQTQPLMDTLDQIPQTSYTLYRHFMHTGDRAGYETPYFLKRARLAAASLRLFLGLETAYGAMLRDLVHDYVWAICEESTWVLPAHESVAIDLFAAETGFMLAETLCLLGPTLETEIRHRVRQEIEHRIFTPYLRLAPVFWWQKGHNNWNGVCNSAIAATFLLVEPEPGRRAHALELALAGLQVFLDTAFEADGSSTEGVAYWHYGLMNVVVLAEMLRACSGGTIDLLASTRMRQIAAYPAKLHLSGSSFASFSDCDETIHFHPGILTRLADRTGERSLLALLAPPAEPATDWRLPMMLRTLLWWDGRQPDAIPVEDAVLPAGGVARLVGCTPAGRPVVLAIKAGHNGENHNQNDVGSFLVHVGGETLLTDPGRGLYTREYFSDRRYENLFANSYGHSVPRINGQVQGTGRSFAGELFGIEQETGAKRAVVEFARAYPVTELTSARRELWLAIDGVQTGVVWLHDRFRFTGQPGVVEEALITWQEVEVAGETALIHGPRQTLRLVIESPAGVSFALERFEEQSRTNGKSAILKRLNIALPAAQDLQVRVRMEVVDSASAAPGV